MRVDRITRFSATLDTAEGTEAVKAFKGTVAKPREKGLSSYILNSMILSHTPKDLYFDEYYQVKGEANLNTLIARENAKRLEDLDRDEKGRSTEGVMSLMREQHKTMLKELVAGRIALPS